MYLNTTNVMYTNYKTRKKNKLMINIKVYRKNLINEVMWAASFQTLMERFFIGRVCDQKLY